MSKFTKGKGLSGTNYMDIVCIHCKFRDGTYCIEIKGYPDYHCPACPIEKPKKKLLIMDSTEALREIASKYLKDELNTEMLIQWEGIMRLRTIENLISEHYYPKEFTLWATKLKCNPFGILFYSISNTMDLTFKDIDEAFNWWKENYK